MEKGFDVKGPVIRTILVMVIIAIGFSLAGCNEEMAKIKEKQINLLTMAEANAQRIAAVSEEQVKLQETVQNSDTQTTDKIALLEQIQTELRAGIEEMRDNTQNVAADMAADITNVKDEQAKFYETVQSNSQQFTNNVALIEQNQQQWQGKIEDLQENIQEVTTRISTLGDDLLKLQDVLQSNIRELVSAMDLSGQEQLKFQEKIQKNLQAFDSSISTIKQSQEKLQSQIEDVQNSAEIMSSELPAAIEQLREEIERNSSMETEENQPPPETNSVE